VKVSTNHQTRSEGGNFFFFIDQSVLTLKQSARPDFFLFEINSHTSIKKEEMLNLKLESTGRPPKSESFLLIVGLDMKLINNSKSESGDVLT
jgi:hypothetical protein